MNIKPIKDYLLDFLDYCEIEKGLSANTQRNYEQYLKLFIKWLIQTKKENLKPHQLTYQDVWDYRLFLARKYRTPRDKFLTKKSQNYYLIALRSLLDFFADRDIQSLPSSKVKLAKQETSDHVSFLTVHEIEKLVSIPDTQTKSGLRNRAILELFFSSGMRVSELVSLDRRDLYFLEDKKFNNKKTFEISIVGKGSHVRTVFISERAAYWLRKYFQTRSDSYKPAFINYKSRTSVRRLTPRTIQEMISRYARMAGLSKKVTPHTMRHSYATDLLSHGADLRAVQELLGHKNVATTQVYTHVTNKQLKEIHEKYHGGNK